MSRKIRYCSKCSKYSIVQQCPSCGGEAQIAGPQRFSPEDRYGEYRRRAKREQMK